VVEKLRDIAELGDGFDSDKFKKIFSRTKGKTEAHLRGLVIGERKWVVISLSKRRRKKGHVHGIIV